MTVRLVIIELSAMLALHGFAIAQVTTPPDGSMSSSITCAPSARPQAVPGSNLAPSSSMAEMCTAADPWRPRPTGVGNDRKQFVGPVGNKSLNEHSHNVTGTALSAGNAGVNRNMLKMQ
jgi:hypothetical protein